MTEKKEHFKGKEVIDVTPKDKTVKDSESEAPKKMPIVFFTVSILGGGNRPNHIIVKAESALQALTYVQDVKKAPVMGVHVTEYSEYLDAQAEPCAHTAGAEDTEKAIIM